MLASLLGELVRVQNQHVPVTMKGIDSMMNDRILDGKWHGRFDQEQKTSISQVQATGVERCSRNIKSVGEN